MPKIECAPAGEPGQAHNTHTHTHKHTPSMCLDGRATRLPDCWFEYALCCMPVPVLPYYEFVARRTTSTCAALTRTSFTAFTAYALLAQASFQGSSTSGLLAQAFVRVTIAVLNWHVILATSNALLSHKMHSRHLMHTTALRLDLSGLPVAWACVNHQSLNTSGWCSSLPLFPLFPPRRSPNFLWQ